MKIEPKQNMGFAIAAIVILAIGISGVAQASVQEQITVEGTCIYIGYGMSTGYVVFILTDTGETYNFFIECSAEPDEGIQLGCTLRVTGTIANPPFDVNSTCLELIEIENLRPIAKPSIGDIDEEWIGKEVELETIIKVVEDMDGSKIITVEDYYSRGQTIRTAWVEGEVQTLQSESRSSPLIPWEHAYYHFGYLSLEDTPEPGFYIQTIYGVVEDWNGEIMVRALIIT